MRTSKNPPTPGNLHDKVNKGGVVGESSLTNITYIVKALESRVYERKYHVESGTVYRQKVPGGPFYSVYYGAELPREVVQEYAEDFQVIY